MWSENVKRKSDTLVGSLTKQLFSTLKSNNAVKWAKGETAFMFSKATVTTQGFAVTTQPCLSCLFSRWSSWISRLPCESTASEVLLKVMHTDTKAIRPWGVLSVLSHWAIVQGCTSCRRSGGHSTVYFTKKKAEKHRDISSTMMIRWKAIPRN